MVWAGSPFAQRIEFSTGLPVGAVAYALSKGDGTILLDETVTPEEGAVSHTVVIDGAHNGCQLPLFETRRLAWHYLTADGFVSSETSYRVDRLLPIAATAEGVRDKLGVETHELTDDEIDLMSAYARFDDLFEAGAVAAFGGTGDKAELLAIHAIEAIAALVALPTLQIKLAQRETSGTDEFQRFGTVDWSRIEGELGSHIERARTAIDPAYDGTTAGAVVTFSTAGRTLDGFTGSNYA